MAAGTGVNYIVDGENNQASVFNRPLQKVVENVDNDFALKTGTYSGLRAQSTTKADVGLGSVDNLSTADYDDRYANTVAADIIVTVDAAGDYQSINEALEALSKNVLAHKNGGLNAEINILSGHIIKEYIHVKNIDLSWITITSQDAEVTVDASFLTQPAGVLPQDANPFIFVSETGQSPSIAFDMFCDDNTADVCVCLVRGVGSKATFKSFGSRNFRSGLNAMEGGEIYLNGQAVVGEGVGIGGAIWLTSGAKLLADSNLTTSKTTTTGLRLDGGTTAVISGNYTCSDAVVTPVYGIFIENASSVRIGGDCLIDNSNRGVNIDDGSEVAIGLDLTVNTCFGWGVSLSRNSKLTVGGICFLDGNNRPLEVYSSDFRGGSVLIDGATGEAGMTAEAGSNISITNGFSIDPFLNGYAGTTYGVRVARASIIRSGNNSAASGTTMDISAVDASQIYCGGLLTGTQEKLTGSTITSSL